MLKRINCRSENSKGVYCLQYDDTKIVSGLRDNTIKIWDRSDLQCVKTLTGHTGSVLCLQYDDKVIISGSSDSTVRVWHVETGEMVNTLIHHCEAVLHLRFNNGMMVTCSKVVDNHLNFALGLMFTNLLGLGPFDCRLGHDLAVRNHVASCARRPPGSC